jgi:osmotically-inducible protein OsmY
MFSLEERLMKTDTQLRQDVFEELRWDPQVGASEIGVAVKDGVATLSGTVANYAQKYAAERAAERVVGIRAIADDLTVKLPTSLTRTDTEIAHAALNALRWDTEVPDDKIKVKVDEGWVWLNGTLEWQYQKAAAERAVRYLAGVKGVTNSIGIKPRHPSPMEVGQRIKAAMRRTAEVDAEKIHVDAKDGRITLRGSVRSWAERQDAERAAWAAPGVTAVEDQITVAPV